jgi:hypothetical protein
MNRGRIKERVGEIAYHRLQQQGYVRPLDILLGLGWLNPVHDEKWRKGEVPYLESVVQANLGKVSFAMKEFRRWALARGLKPSETAYVARTRGPKEPLKFSRTGDPDIELAYRTHYVSAALTEKKREKLTERLSQPPELVVYSIVRESQCSKCCIALSPGAFLLMEKGVPLCLACSKMNHLVFLPAGDAGITRRAKQSSSLWAVVVRFSRHRKRYERQGLLVEKSAAEAAELRD